MNGTLIYLIMWVTDRNRRREREHFTLLRELINMNRYMKQLTSEEDSKYHN